MAVNEVTEEVGEELSRCSAPLESRPGILIVGSSGVGKRTVLSRLLSLDLDDDLDSDSQLLVRGWTIDTKYYAADVSVWVAHLTDGFRIENFPDRRRLAALVMVFDATDPSSLASVQDWVSSTDIHEFEILLCVGNKVDLVSGHPVHQEYRRRLMRRQQKLKLEQSSTCEFGITETEGTNLLDEKEEEEEEEEEHSSQIRKSCLEWCTERNIEYIEACASNPEFDKCLSVDGDSQGIERLLGALSAHMWPGMVLKSGNKVAEPSLTDGEDLSDEDSDYELEYEVLSEGSAEPWNDSSPRWVSAECTTSAPSAGESVENRSVTDLTNGEEESCRVISDAGEAVAASDHESREKCDLGNLKPPGESSEEDHKGAMRNAEVVAGGNEERNEVAPFDFEDLEQLMSEVGNIRDNLRLMPDFQRREMAANLAMKMASMFGGGSDDEEEELEL
ncbi:hypothetical protein LINPERPRIM_LOCUS9333 [Linum perenne]